MGKNRDQRGQGLRDRAQSAVSGARDRVQGLADNLADRLETLTDRIQQPPSGRIRRVVVLMLENRSFDHMMGWLGPARGGPPAGVSNQATLPDGKVVTETLFRTTDTRLRLDPPHASAAVVRHQVADGAMSGFVQAVVDRRAKELKKHDGEVIAEADPKKTRGLRATPMACYGPEQVPVFAFLAEHYAVCANWFCSVGSGTWPNRMFLYAGTSAGETGNGQAVGRSDRLWDGINGNGKLLRRNPDTGAIDSEQYTFPDTLLVDRLEKHKIDYEVYSHGFAWMRLVEHHNFRKRHSRDIRHFADDCREGKLPPMVFVDPNWAEGRDLHANDDHVPADITNGQRLVAEVYNALLTQPDNGWQQTLLVVTYDEHGGFYDHVPPPPAPGAAPGDGPDFQRLGLRVPTFLVSPFIEPGTVLTPDQPPLDHCSLHDFIRRTLIPKDPPLSARVGAANPLDVALTRKLARTDAPQAPVPNAVRHFPGRVEPRYADDDDDGGLRAALSRLGDRR
jgi:phospholipase C